MGVISGGDKLNAALNKIASKLDKGGAVKIGFLEGSTDTQGMSLPLKAALNEFGHQNANGSVTPPRPFMRNTVAAKSGEWPDAIAGLLKATNYDVEKTLTKTGEGVAKQLRESILDMTEPPLSPVTIARKGNAQLLIDSGDMIRGIAFEVNVK